MKYFILISKNFIWQSSCLVKMLEVYFCTDDSGVYGGFLTIVSRAYLKIFGYNMHIGMAIMQFSLFLPVFMLSKCKIHSKCSQRIKYGCYR